MRKLLIVVDMQNDLISGALGTSQAISIVPKVVEKIKNWDGDILCTKDTHFNNYKETNEGKHLPVEHCIVGTWGYQIDSSVTEALENKGMAYISIDKNTFGCRNLTNGMCVGYNYIELVGLCTDICVVSNALLLKAFYPEIDIAVDVSCCAGVTPESHKAAITTMKMCQIDVIGE